ncbi:MAG: 4Fe-4S dicluster domain-containing protein [Candidatus Bathyarchaeia archaeon]
MEMKKFFICGSIRVDMEKCKGLGCQSCINTCPTKALYWRSYPGKIEIVEDRCVFCAACVLSCPVERCIYVFRKRNDSISENFSSQKDVIRLFNIINSRKRACLANCLNKEN